MRSTCGQKINDIFSLLSYFIGNTTKKVLSNDNKKLTLINISHIINIDRKVI